MEKDNITWIKENTLYLLFRRGNPEHIKALYEKGEIYLNTVDYIRKCDDNEDRSDPHDGVSKRLFLGDVKVRMCKVGKDMDKHGINFDANNAVMIEDSEKKGNIYCLSGIFSEDLMGERNNLQLNTKSFGEALILIYNPKEFIKRVLDGLKTNGYENVIYKRVSYYPNEYSGPIGMFRKHEKFNPQNEIRIFVPNEKNESIKINIGSLNDIAYIENNTLLELTYTDGKEQIIRFV
jgi:hypothetical protein